MNKYKFLSVAALIIILNISRAIAQNTNQNQINNTVPHNNNSANPTQNTSPNVNQNNNSGSVNGENNNINNPYTTVPFDSANNHPSGGIIITPPAPKHDALQEHRKILNQSGQNQVIIPPNPAGPDTSTRQIPSTGINNNSAPDRKGKIEDQKPVNPTIMGSPSDSIK